MKNVITEILKKVANDLQAKESYDTIHVYINVEQFSSMKIGVPVFLDALKGLDEHPDFIVVPYDDKGKEVRYVPLEKIVSIHTWNYAH